MPDPALHVARLTPLRRLAILALGALLLVSVLPMLTTPSVMAGAPDRRDQLHFMWAMAGQESGWDYYARNRSSGAFGKYQIMPSNWPAWAAEYLGNARADQTPWNQEKVAFGKIHDLYRWLGSWKRVAYWWLTGSSQRNERRWSSYAAGYVRSIMKQRERAPRRGGRMPPRTSSIAGRGDWRRSAVRQELRHEVGGRAWQKRGRLRDGQVLRVRRSRARKGVRWIQIVTADGRLGWLKQLRTVPARRPQRATRWRDVDDRGDDRARQDRSFVRPRPR